MIPVVTENLKKEIFTYLVYLLFLFYYYLEYSVFCLSFFS